MIYIRRSNAKNFETSDDPVNRDDNTLGGDDNDNTSTDGVNLLPPTPPTPEDEKRVLRPEIFSPLPPPLPHQYL